MLACVGTAWLTRGVQPVVLLAARHGSHTLRGWVVGAVLAFFAGSCMLGGGGRPGCWVQAQQLQPEVGGEAAEGPGSCAAVGAQRGSKLLTALGCRGRCWSCCWPTPLGVLLLFHCSGFLPLAHSPGCPVALQAAQDEGLYSHLTCN